MILIISHNGGTANKVIDWADSYGIKVHRINPYIDKVNIHAIELSNKKVDFELELDAYGVKTRLSDYTGIWVWHSHVWFENCEPTPLTQEKNAIIDELQNSLDRHHTILINYFSAFLLHSRCKTIGNYGAQNLNKLEVLFRAKLLGIPIPDTYIFSQKKQIEELTKHTTIITKPYHEIIFINYNEAIYQNYTSDVTSETIQKVKPEIYPTLFQKKIQKVFEIRSFFLMDTFYSMAIFSQESAKTQVDFRNYNLEKPNRTVPIKLPLNLERKLKKLFKNLNLNSGSIDLIYTKDDEYVFLEINPIGQFGMVSYPCNYYLEKLIIQTLI